MNYETLIMVLDILIYPIAFFVFLIIIKVGFKKRCGGGKILAAGFFIFFSLSLITLTIVDGIINPPLDISWNYIEYPLGMGMIGLLSFALLYATGKPIYDKIKKKKLKSDKQITRRIYIFILLLHFTLIINYFY